MTRGHLHLIASLLVGLAFTSGAQAGVCDFYRRNEPALYKYFCDEGSGATKPAGANSTFSDAFNINTASLPTEPSSYGLESIGSYLRDDPSTLGGTFSLIKGYHRFGTGISTGSNNTFYGNDVVERLSGMPNVDSFSPHETAQGHFTNLNLGTSMLLYDGSGGPQVRLGISVRYNNTTNTWGWGPGLMVSWNYITIGGGYTREQVSNFLPTQTFESFLISGHYSIFELEFNVLNVPQEPQLSLIQIISLTATLGRVTLTGAVRSLNYISTGQVTQEQLAIQYMFNQHFSAGLLYNYIPGANSVGTQIFL